MLNGWRASFGNIPSGTPGVRETLKQMVKICRKFLRPNPQDEDAIQSLLMVRLCAQRCVQMCPEKDYYSEVAALHRYVRDEIRYTMDHLTAELLQYPDKTLIMKSGDCDDKSLLLCAMAHCVGYPSRFCAIAIEGDNFFSHVSPQVLINGIGWTNCETIPIDDDGTKVDMGWFPPDVGQIMMANV